MKNYHTKYHEAQDRKRGRDSITPEQQLKELDLRLGVGQGAIKERQRLNNLITKVA